MQTYSDLQQLIGACCHGIQHVSTSIAATASECVLIAGDEDVRKRIDRSCRRALVGAILSLEKVANDLGNGANASDIVCDEDEAATDYMFDALKRFHESEYGVNDFDS